MIPEVANRAEMKAAFVDCSVPRAGEVYRVRLSHGVVERWKVVRIVRSHRPEHIIYERKGIAIPEQNFVPLGLDKVTCDAWYLLLHVHQLVYFGYDP